MSLHKLPRLVLALLLMLSGSVFAADAGLASSAWPKFRQNNTNTALGVGSGCDGSLRWSFDAGSTLYSSVAIGANGWLYFGSDNGVVHAVDAVTGEAKWSQAAGTVVQSSPAVAADGTVYVGSSDSKVYALDGTTGAVKWTFVTGAPIYSSPAVADDGTIYVGSNDKKVYGINPDGSQKWVFSTSNVVFSAPAIGAGGTVYVGSMDGYLYALNGSNGAEIWRYQAPAAIRGAPAVGAGDVVFVGCYGGTILAVNGGSGTFKWQTTVASSSTFYSSPAVGSDGTVYIGCNDANLYAFNGSTGAEKWHLTTGGAVYSSPAVGPDNVVYVGSADHKIYAVNGATGAKNWDYVTGNVIWASPVIGADGSLYVGSTDHSLYALGQGLTIKGTITRAGGRPLAGVTLTASTGEVATTAADGTYTLSIPQDWTGTVTPSRASGAWTFTPGSRSYTAVTANQTGQDYAAQCNPDGGLANTAWPKFKQGGRNQGRGTGGRSDGIKLWEYATGGQVSSSPVIGLGGKVYVGSDDDYVYALNPSTGAKLWQAPMGSAVLSAPVVGVDGTVYAAGSDGHVHALNGGTGSEIWSFEASGNIDVSPTLGPDGTVYFGTWNNKFYALNSSSGARLWDYTVDGAVRSSAAIGSDGSIYFCCTNGSIYALDSATGGLYWTTNIGRSLRSSPAVAADGTIYVGVGDGTVRAFNGATGAQLWSSAAGDDVQSSPSIGADGTIYVGSSDGKVYALDPSDGTHKWATSTGGPVVSSPAISADGAICVGSTSGAIYALDGDNGAVIWTFDAGSAVISSPAISADGTIYCGAASGKVYALATGLTISGTVTYAGGGAASGVTLSVFDGTNASTVTTAADGTYAYHVLSGWSGRIQPALASGWTSNPDVRDYSNLTTDQSGQDFAINYDPNGGLADSAWPKFRHDGKNTGVGTSSDCDGVVRWTQALGGAVASSPAISADGVVYVGAADGNLHALDGITGASLWQGSTAGAVQSSPVVGLSGTIYVGSDDNSLYAFNGTTHATRWAFATGGAVVSSPTVNSAGLAFVGSSNGTVYAVTLSTGLQAWAHATDGAVTSSPALAGDGTVYVGSEDGKVYALDGSTGSSRWTFTAGAGVHSSPAVAADGTVIVGCRNHSVYALLGSNGAKRWQFDTGGPVLSSPALGTGGTVVVGSEDGYVYALNLSDGAEAWRFAAGSAVTSSPAVAADGTIYVGCASGRVYALNGATGAKLWSVTTGGAVTSSPALGADGWVYVGSADGKLYALGTGVVITGRVASADGTACAGCTVAASDGTTATTEADGTYRLALASGFTGTVSLTSTGGRLVSPTNYGYSGLAADVADQDFALGVLVSGKVTDVAESGMAGVTISATGGYTVSTAADGTYTLALPAGYSGTVSAVFTGWAFAPSSYIYSSQVADLTDQDFRVAPGLSFTQQPTDGFAGTPLAPVTVAMVQPDGTVDQAATGDVTLSLLSSPVGATLSGTLTLALDHGQATFADLTLDRIGSGYVLRATLAGSTADSMPFAILNRGPIADAGANRRVEQTSGAGAMVLLDGSASSDPDAVAGDGIVLYAWLDSLGLPLASGTNPQATVLLPGGTNTVTLRVTDTHGAVGTDTVDITVSDTTGPVLNLPADIVVMTTNAEAATVAFTVTATDAVSGSCAVTCTPASGSAFPVGTTTVNVSSADAAGNPSTGSFTVTVRSAGDLTFLDPITDGHVGTPLTSVRLAVLDAEGHVYTGSTGDVTISLGNAPTDGVLSGTLTRSFVDGVATFDDLTLNRIFAGYTLHAAAGDQSVFSAEFAIVNRPPVANAGGAYLADLDAGTTLDGTASSDPDAVADDSIVSYEWTIGALTKTGATPALSAAEIADLGLGSHTVSLKVTDTFGATNTATTTLTVCDNRPFASFTAVPNPTAPGTPVTFDASASHHGRPDRTIVSYAWNFGDGQTGTGQTTTHSYSHFGSYTVTLTITDDNDPAKTDTDTTTVNVNQGNRAPVANAGGAYIADLGSGLTLDGTASSDPDAAAGDSIVSYAWTIGTLTKTGATPALSAAEITELGLGSHTVSLTVTDTFGATNTATTTLTVCDNRPFASFTAVPNPAAPGTPVTFDASASHHGRPDRTIVSYAWNFGDGQTGTGQTTTHSYSHFGSYTVTLTITDDNDPAKTDTATTIVDVNQGNRAPVANAGGAYIANLGEAITLDGTASSDPDAAAGDSIVSYEWTIGVLSKTGATPVLTADEINAFGLGQRTVSLKVTDTFGATNTAETTLSIYDNRPFASFTLDPNPTGPNHDITFDAKGSSHGRPDRAIVSYAWDFGDGATDTGVQVTHHYALFGTYTVTLTVTDNNVPAKTDSTTRQVSISLCDGAPTANAGGPYGVDLGSGVQFDGSGSSDPDIAAGDHLTYAWAVGTINLTGMQPTLNAAQVTSLGAGAHQVSLTVTDSFGASDTATATLTIYDNRPVASFTATPNPAPTGQAITFDASASAQLRPDRGIVEYHWDFGGGATGTGKTVTHAYSTPGDHTVTLTVTDDNVPAKSDSTSRTVTVVESNHAPIADAGPDQTVPQTAPGSMAVQLDGSGSSDPDAGDGIVSYQWLNAGGTEIATGVQPTINLPAGIAVITLRVTDTHGATGTDTVTITVADQAGPVLSLPSDLVVFTGDPAGKVVTFTATANDAVDGAVPVTCVPASGSLFPVGETTVLAGARDNAGNLSAGSFKVTVVLVSRLAFTRQPTNGQAGITLAPVEVSLLDAGGQPMTTANATVTLSLAAGPTGAVLSGTLAKPTTAGVATYSDLKANLVGTTYRLRATALGLTVDSDLFAIAQGATDPAQSTANVPGGKAGTWTTITVQARDAAGNKRTVGGDTVSIKVTGANAATPTVTDNKNGTYTARYYPFYTGNDSVVITLNGVALGGSPYTSVVGAGASSAAQSVATVPPGQTSLPTTIVVQARDGIGNNRTTGGDTVVVRVTGANTVTPAVTDNGNGTYTAVYTPANGGVDTVAITLAGTAIKNSPYTSLVCTGPTDAAHSTADVPAGKAGSWTTITVQARDADGNKRGWGGDTVSIKVTGANAATPTVTDNGNGTYTARYYPFYTGNDSVAITLNGVALGGSPYTSVVGAGPTSAVQSVATVPPGQTSLPTTIVVQARDGIGNNRTTGGDTVVVQVTGANTVTPAVTDNGNGTYTAVYTPTNGGVDTVAITLAGTAIKNSPYTSLVCTGPTSAAQSTADVPAGKQYSWTTITVQARDANGNKRGWGGDVVAISVTGANKATPTVTDNGNGTYTARYYPFYTGTDSVAITLNGQAIGGSPFASVVGK